MYTPNTLPYNDFGALKYITNHKEPILWFDPKEPRVILDKYLSGTPLRAIAAEHGKSIDQIRDFALKLKNGVLSSLTHFATMKTEIVAPMGVISNPNMTFFRDGTPMQNTKVLYIVPGTTFLICATSLEVFEQVPDWYEEGGTAGVHGDTLYSLPEGKLTLGAAIKRTFWNQQTEHSVMLFNAPVIRALAPWLRNFCEPAFNPHIFMPSLHPIFEDLLYIKGGKLHSFYPDILHDDGKLSIKVRGVRIQATIPPAIIQLGSLI